MKPVSTAAALLVASALCSCAHTTPDAMSAADHDREEMQHRQAAADDAAHYDPHATAVTFSNEPGEHSPFLITYNPTDRYLDFADAERRHADAHARAAKALRDEETSACGDAPAEARAACPLLTPWVARVVEMEHGVSLELKTNAPAAAVFSRMQCHLQHERVEGFPKDDAALCPLFLEGTTLSLHGNAIEVSAPSRATSELIRQDARRMFGAPATQTAREVK